MGKTSIEWTESTWNPIRGCSKVSPECSNCYAETIATRYSGAGCPFSGVIKNAHWNNKIELVPHKLREPFTWHKPRMIFTGSMTDIFHKDVPDEYLDKMFCIMAMAPWHTFQVLTKRSERMKEYLTALYNGQRRLGDQLKHVIRESDPHGDNAVTRIALARAFDKLAGAFEKTSSPYTKYGPFQNIWCGVSIGSNDYKKRGEDLIQTPAACRFISYEPALGPLDLSGLIEGNFDSEEFPSINWVICGGESGPGARPMHPDWAESVRDQCLEHGVNFFFKQWGCWSPWPEHGAKKLVYGKNRIQIATSGYINERYYSIDEGGMYDRCMYRTKKKVAGRLLPYWKAGHRSKKAREWRQMPKFKHGRWQ